MKKGLIAGLFTVAVAFFGAIIAIVCFLQRGKRCCDGDCCPDDLDDDDDCLDEFNLKSNCSVCCDEKNCDCNEKSCDCGCNNSEDVEVEKIED